MKLKRRDLAIFNSDYFETKGAIGFMFFNAMKDEYFGFQKLILVFCKTFARRHFEFFFATRFCQNCNFGKHFYGWAWVSIRYFDFKCYTIVSTFRKTRHNQWALMPKGDK